ncbi:hypothetical protein N7533_004270 [Penicillium manginii]|uniref:uncharacterized protein n=1 Tax=Penicillium manginii TaxID=203109 RepID=UPI002546A02E|nr:uncharacterized protein N7533_004270 [Penicillium manginii]KAJ5754727.1 hypothetical protein N7533_004270 [Penicillium manginii]
MTAGDKTASVLMPAPEIESDGESDSEGLLINTNRERRGSLTLLSRSPSDSAGSLTARVTRPETPIRAAAMKLLRSRTENTETPFTPRPYRFGALQDLDDLPTLKSWCPASSRASTAVQEERIRKLTSGNSMT